MIIEDEAIQIALNSAHNQYADRNPESLQKHTEACRFFPGGNTRSSLFYRPFPLTMIRGEGPNLWDADGHKYTDFLGEHTAGLFGHSHPVIHSAIYNALADGIDLGAHNCFEAKLAALVCARFPSIELVRFTNSGTEANLMAVSTARAITKRNKILVFDGAYHGSVFNFARNANPLNAPFEFIISNYNNIDKTLAVIEENSSDLAAVMIEPMMGPGGCIPAEKLFLQKLRDTTRRDGIILIFDEIMTSRLSPGGLQEMFGIIPDITTLGKYIGGGLTFGAFGGNEGIMGHYDARLPNAFPHAGTFNNNILTMSAGYAGILLYTPEITKLHNERGDYLRNQLNKIVEKNGVNMQVTGIGSMLNFHMLNKPIKNPEDAAKANMKLRELFFFDLIAEGVWVGQHGLLALSLSLTETDYQNFVEIFEHIIDKRRQFIKI